MKQFFKIFLFVFLSLAGGASTFAEGQYLPVEDVFSDIDKNYKYYHEVQELYNRWILFPDANGKLNPTKLLNRDEFVGISMEIICKKCIQPNTELEFLQAYTWKNVYFDINEANPYFYCVAEADNKQYVKWYVQGDVCQNNTSKEWERPFCPDNKITKEEAYAVIMRNSKIWTIAQNAVETQAIIDGYETEKLSDDVYPKNSDGSPYTFYGYFKKALQYQLVEYDTNGKEKIYKLLETKDNKIYPKQYITKEEFIYLAYIALKWNSCPDTAVKNNIALKMKIRDKSCKASDKECKLSDLEDSDNTYDFLPIVETTCKEWVADPNGYMWRFVNLNTGAKFFLYGKYLDNVKLPEVWERRIYLRVVDNCSQTAEIYSTIMVKDTTLDTWIKTWEDTCKTWDVSCVRTTSCDANGNRKCDVIPEIKTTCTQGVDESGYDWTFTHIATGYQEHRTGSYINDFNFQLEWVRRIDLTVTDKCWKKKSETTRVSINTTLDTWIKTWEDTCKAWDVSCVRTTSCDSNGNKKCDVIPEIKTTCSQGVDESGYDWLFTHIATGYQERKTGSYINDFNFSLEWIRRIDLTVTDKCWKRASSTTKILIWPSLKLNVTILANPIMGYAPLLVSYEGIITWGTPPYKYNWSFWDGGTWVGKYIDYIFQNEGVYTTKLIGTDSEWRTWEATVVIKVLQRDCTIDNDWDGIPDCDDKCPLVKGTAINKGCPVYEPRCSVSCGCDPWYSCDTTDPAICPIKWVCKPIVNKSACLYDSSKDLIYGNVVCNSCPCDKFIDFITTLRKCDIVFPAITSPTSTEIYSKWNIYNISR